LEKFGVRRGGPNQNETRAPISTEWLDGLSSVVLPKYPESFVKV
jgi:hypothetical protein